MTVQALLHMRLSTFAGLTALVGTRVYPNIAPQNAARPYVAYRLVSDIRPPAMGRDSGVARARFQFDAFADEPAGGYDAADAIRVQIAAALKRWRDAGPPVVQDTFLVSQIDLYEDDIRMHNASADYELNYRE